ncbi:hypothetical protein GGR51DRAFT_500250 [Nemania sp. FL0031]|nr:hypothetical protein GGR51DRAFT_500250 [Nemania sp. FL0031]
MKRVLANNPPPTIRSYPFLSQTFPSPSPLLYHHSRVTTPASSPHPSSLPPPHPSTQQLLITTIWMRNCGGTCHNRAVSFSDIPSPHHRHLTEAIVIYQSKHRLLHRHRRDALVADALKGAGYQLTKTDIRRAFVPMFQIATPIFIDARAESKSLWDMLSEVKRELDWARALSEAVFLELFTCLVEARFN